MKRPALAVVVLALLAVMPHARAQSFRIALDQSEGYDPATGPTIRIAMQNLTGHGVRLLNYASAAADYKLVVAAAPLQAGMPDADTQPPNAEAVDTDLQSFSGGLIDLPPRQSIYETFRVADLFSLRPGRYKLQVSRKYIEQSFDRATVSNIVYFTIR